MNQHIAALSKHRRPLREVLQKMSMAMLELNRTTSDLEDALLSTELEEGQNGKRSVAHLQKLDMILQMSDELAHLLSRLADQAPDHDDVAILDLIAPIRLERLHQILCGPEDQSMEKVTVQRRPQVTLF